MSKRHVFEDGSVADFDDDISEETIRKFGDGTLGEISGEEHDRIVAEAEEAREVRDDDGEPDGIAENGG